MLQADPALDFCVRQNLINLRPLRPADLQILEALRIVEITAQCEVRR